MGLEDRIYNYLCKASNKILSLCIETEKNYKSILDISLDEVKELKGKYGIGGIILDVDGTIRSESYKIPEKNVKWIEFMRKQFKMCIVSNGCDKNVKNLADSLKIPYFSFAMKPKRKPFLKAADIMGIEPQNILVIGNEYITDILGGQRCGMFTAVVDEVDVER